MKTRWRDLHKDPISWFSGFMQPHLAPYTGWCSQSRIRHATPIAHETCQPTQLHHHGGCGQTRQTTTMSLQPHEDSLPPDIPTLSSHTHTQACTHARMRTHTCSRLMRSYMRPASRTMRVATSPALIPWPGPGGRGGSLAYLHQAGSRQRFPAWAGIAGLGKWLWGRVGQYVCAVVAARHMDAPYRAQRVGGAVQGGTYSCMEGIGGRARAAAARALSVCV